MIITERGRFNQDIIDQKREFEKRLAAIGIKQPNKYKARFTKGRNVKLGTATYSLGTLPTNKEYDTTNAFGKDYIDMSNPEDTEAYKKLATLRGTCGRYCEGCEHACYAIKGEVRYHHDDENGHETNTQILGRARKTNALRNLDQSFYELDSQLSHIRNNGIFRLHSSGELESADQLRMYITLAERHPEKTFYIYTKAVDYYEPVLDEEELPDNFWVLISLWDGSPTVDSYKKYRNKKNVKAFACVNHSGLIATKYPGLKPTIMCPGYLVKGVTKNRDSLKLIMNPDSKAKCDQCTCCFSERGGKIVGCWEH